VSNAKQCLPAISPAPIRNVHSGSVRGRYNLKDIYIQQEVKSLGHLQQTLLGPTAQLGEHLSEKLWISESLSGSLGGSHLSTLWA